MRNALYTSEQTMFLCEAQKCYMETEFTQLKTFIADKIYQDPVPQFVEAYLPDEVSDENLTESALADANSMFR